MIDEKAKKIDTISLENAREIPIWKMVWAGEPYRKIQVLMTYDDLKNIVEKDERHGRWIKEPGAWHLDDEKRTSVNILKCSECGMYYQNAPYNFCPNCGVPMDKE